MSFVFCSGVRIVVRMENAEVERRRAAHRTQISIEASKLRARAEPPPNPNGGYVEEVIATGKNSLGTRYRSVREGQLKRYFDGGQIDQDQFDVGSAYANDLALLYRSGRDTLGSTRSDLGATDHLTEAQSDALRRVIAIDDRLTAKDRVIVRKVCGEDHTAIDAVAAATGVRNFAFAVPRFLEAMIGLVKATHQAKRAGWARLVAIRAAC